MIISKTPLRISLAGGGTDLPSFYKKNEYGAVLSTSIDSYIYVTIKKHTKLFDEKFRLNYSEVELTGDISEIKNSIIRECLNFSDIDESLYISTIADSPASSGLGSSSSFCVGLLNALYKYKGINVSIGQLAEESAHIELNMLRRPMGKQDHYAAAYGGLNYFEFHSDESVTVKPLCISKKTKNILFESMLSFWTRISRPSEAILSEQDKNNHKNTETLLKMRQQANDCMELLCREKFDIKEFGQLVHKGWLMKCNLASSVSNSLIDKCYQIGLKNGAYGGKISGAGGGGFLNIFADKENHHKIIKALEKEGFIYYKFDSNSLGTTVTRIE